MATVMLAATEFFGIPVPMLCGLIAWIVYCAYQKAIADETAKKMGTDAGGELTPHRIGAALAARIGQVVRERRSIVQAAVGGEQRMVEANLVVLFNWTTTRRLSAIIPAKLCRPILDAMHEPMFIVLTGMGLSKAEAESFVHRRYEEYQSTIDTLEGDAAAHRISACFVGFCNNSGYYSLSQNPFEQEQRASEV